MIPRKIYGLIGFPVKHSLSPAMHNAAFKALKIDAEYKLFEVKPQDLHIFLHSLSGKNIFGLNVTIPYKEKVIEEVSLDRESFFLRQIKAVNTIVVEDSRLKGFNTDIPGFERDLKEKNVDPQDKAVAIIGAGGASRAVSYVTAKNKAKEIVIYDIDKAKCSGIIEMIEGIFADFNITAVDSIEQLDIRNKDILINATPIGMKDSDPCLVEKNMFSKGVFVYDLIYNPPETKLLALAREAGAKTANGLGMLLCQGMLSFEIWTGQNAPQKVMREALLAGIS